MLPDDFIGLAIGSGIGREIDRFVLDCACQDAMSWPEDVAVAVNMPAQRFAGRVLVDDVEHALAKSGLQSWHLELEVTEDSPFPDYIRFGEICEDLNSIGVILAIDDFGVGFSNLTTLCIGSFSKLKSDKCFTGSPSATGREETIAKSVADLGRSLSMTTVAEGIESDMQLRKIQSFGYTLGQGFFLGRPMPAASVAELLQNVHV